ncbi:MAG: Ig-like domain-containing protein [Thermoplasmatota archaeon]
MTGRFFGEKAVALVLSAGMLLTALTFWEPSAEALTQSFSTGTDYYYGNGGWYGREAMSPIYVNVGLAITRVDVQMTVWANLNGNDAADLDIFVRHPDGTEQQLVWDGTYYSGSSISTTFYDIFRFNNKLSTGQWFLRVRDEGNYGAANSYGGYIDSWTLTIHYQEPSISLISPSSPNAVVSGSLQVSASVQGAGIEDVELFVDGSRVFDLALSGSNYVGTLNTARFLDGTHTITVKATDWEGRTDSKSIDVQFDNFRPRMTLTSDLGGMLRGEHTFLVGGDNGEASMRVNIVISGPGVSIDALMVPLGGGRFAYEWDSSAFPDGDYTVSAYSLDVSGANISIGPYPVTVDNTPPILSLLSPAPGSYASGLVELNLSGTGDAHPGYTQYAVDGGPWVPTSPAWQEAFVVDTTALPDGPHRLRARALDAAGWSTEAFVDVLVSNEEPAIDVVFPSAGDMVEGQLTIRAYASSFAPISSVALTIDGASRAAGLSALTGYFELLLDTASLPDGEHLLTASASDASGKTVAYQGLSFSTDNHAPSLGALAPTEGQRVRGAVNLSAQASDLYLSEVLWSVDSQPAGPMVLDNGSFIAELNTSALVDGQHELVLLARDRIGHETRASVEFVVDNSAPTIEVLSPLEGEFLSGEAVVRVRARDGLGVERVLARISPGPIARELALSAGSGCYELWLDTRALPDGDYTVAAEVRDLAGAVESTGELAFCIDNTPPALTVEYPLPGQRITRAEGERTLDLEADDAFLVAVEFSLDGTGWRPAGAPITPPGLSEGGHALEIRARDAAGHVTTVLTEFVFDAAEPSVLIASPVQDQKVAGFLRVCVGASDALGIASVLVAPDEGSGAPGREAALNPLSSLYEAEFDTSRWLGGDRFVNLTATAEDTSGLRSSTSVRVFVDNSPPEIVRLVPRGTARGSVDFKFTVSDSSRVKRVELRVDGGGWRELTYREASGIYYTTWATDLRDNGAHRYEVRAVDELGNEAVASYTVSVENPDNGWMVWAALAVLLILIVVVVLVGRYRKPKEGVVEPEEPVVEEPGPVPPISGVGEEKEEEPGRREGAAWVEEGAGAQGPQPAPGAKSAPGPLPNGPAMFPAQPGQAPPLPTASMAPPGPQGSGAPAGQAPPQSGSAAGSGSEVDRILKDLEK